MSEVHLIAKIKSIIEEPTIYRVYVDDDLITERTYIWGTKSSINENIVVALEPGNHTIRVENVVTDTSVRPPDGKYIKLFGLQVEGKLVLVTNNVFTLN